MTQQTREQATARRKGAPAFRPKPSAGHPGTSRYTPGRAGHRARKHPASTLIKRDQRLEAHTLHPCPLDHPTENPLACMPEQAQARCKQTIRIKARAMDMNDDRTARKTQSLAASQRRARGEYPSPMQSAGPGDVTGPQAPGRAAATARPSDTKASARPAVAKASARPSDTKASARQ